MANYPLTPYFTFTPRERTAILAALRLCQHGMFNDAYRRMDEWTGSGPPLSADELEDLYNIIDSKSKIIESKIAERRKALDQKIK